MEPARGLTDGSRARPPAALGAGLALGLCAAAGCGGPPPGASDALAELVAREWAARLAADPLLATSVGVHHDDDRLPDVSVGALRAGAERDRALLAELRGLETGTLAPEQRDTVALLARELEGRVRAFELGAHEVPLNSDSGFHLDLLRWPDELPTATDAERRAYLARLTAAPTYVAQQVANMRAGLARGMTLPRVVAEGLGGALEEATRDELLADPTRSAFYAPFRERGEPAGGGAGEAVRGVLRALAGFRAFLDEVYAPGCRTTLAASRLPDGAEYYAWCVRWYTTLDTTPREVHERGRAEVARVRAEMERVVAEAGEGRDFAAFLAELRTNPRFYARSSGELLAFAAARCKRIDGLLPRWFGRLPRQPYGVEPVPEAIAPRYTGGRYVPAPIDSTRAGTYWVNTYDLPSRPLYVLPALTLHEAVPGHHLQIALAQELAELPAFRRHLYVDAFGEGWALYAEWLGREMDVYDGPFEEFGRLSYEMWRACRLVVDTGLHAFDWDRQRAIDYLAQNTALSLRECTTEVDRYIAWPGQALAYKTGELELRRLRAQAEAALGPAFDVRAFHDVVLGAGTVTLEVLGQRVARWLAERP